MTELSNAERVGIPDEARWKGMSSPSHHDPSKMDVYKEKAPSVSF
jgi:hypothetical protein